MTYPQAHDYGPQKPTGQGAAAQSIPHPLHGTMSDPQLSHSGVADLPAPLRNAATGWYWELRHEQSRGPKADEGAEALESTLEQ